MITNQIEDYGERHVRIPDCRCDKATKAALLVTGPCLEGEVWIPVSQLSDDSEVFEDGTDGDLIVTRWIAESKGLV